MIIRQKLLDQIRYLLAQFRVVVLTGPRQVGKTTLARHFVDIQSANYFDLELPADRRRLDQPVDALRNLTGLVAIDEVQRAPDLFPVLRALVDRSDRKGQFLILGSAAPALLNQVGESLLGRAATLEVPGLGIDETSDEFADETTTSDSSSAIDAHEDKLWFRGGYPESFLATNDQASSLWRQQLISRYVESDLAQLGINIPAPAMLRFWQMAAHYNGKIWNSAEPARSLGLSESTVRRYLDVLHQTYMVRQLLPWFENIGKRQVKAPKIIFRDSGIFHSLLGIESYQQLLSHPYLGASWESFVIEQVIRYAKPSAAYFWASHGGAELDLLLIRGQERVGVEVKRSDAPSLTKSMQIAIEDLKLDRLFVVYPGVHRYRLSERVEVVPLNAILANR